MTISNAPTGHRTDAPTAYSGENTDTRVRTQRGVETKASFKTTELIAYVAAVVAVIVTAVAVGTTSGHADYFRADKAMFYIVLLTLGYLGSRGLAKSGSREHYDA